MSLALDAQSLAVCHGRQRVLGPLDLSVEVGEHVLIVGASGSGKTTLLRAIAGLARLENGTLQLLGQCTDREGRQLVPPEQRGVGLLFQSGALWPHMRAGKQVEFVLARRGLARHERRRKATELLELVEIEGLAGRKPGTLSGGEAQRLALARTLASDPRLLLLDEPLGPLDAALRTALLERLDQLQRELELTILHVTHDPDEARSVASRVLEMEAGVFKEPA